MNCAHLFAGFGGFNLASDWMGWNNVFHCEKDNFCLHILKYYWPNAETFKDVKTTCFKKYKGKIDILTGGFPCQPFSVAGKRKGADDDRFLWPEYFRAIKEIQPRWVIPENVSGIINWSKGVVFEQVQSDLENEGYQIIPLVLPACAVNAPHRRDRIWFVAYSPNARVENVRPERQNSISGSKHIADADISGFQEKRPKQQATGTSGNNTQDFITNPADSRQQRKSKGRQIKTRQPKSKIDRKLSLGFERRSSDVTNSTDNGLEKPRDSRRGRIGFEDSNSRDASNAKAIRTQGSRADGQQEPEAYVKKEIFISGSTRTDWRNFPTQSPHCRGDDGFSNRMDAIAVSSRKGSRTLNKKQSYGRWRKETIKGYGNAVVPQLVLQIYQAIDKFEKEFAHQF